MPLTAEQLELPYFIPTSENVHQILAALNETPVQDKDFYLFRHRLDALPWRWEGAGRYIGQRSPCSFATQAAAIKHVQSTLSEA